jgi:5'-3' exonuclease
MRIDLIDGTYELFRHYFAVPKEADSRGQEIAAARGVLLSVLGLIEANRKADPNAPITFVGVATDHVIESFRNELYGGYKTSDGIPPDLHSQFPILEDAMQAMGVRVWPMVRYEADDALASAAVQAARDTRVEQVRICTPDKDLAQCVSGNRIVQVDRRRGIIRDQAGVVEKWGVGPESIPDYLAAVGDTADGYPGLAGWGPKAASTVLARYPHFEDVPKNVREWGVTVRGAERLAAVLFDQWEEALLYRKLATLVLDVEVFERVDDLAWKGPADTAEFERWCSRFEAPELYARVLEAAASQG